MLRYRAAVGQWSRLLRFLHRFVETGSVNGGRVRQGGVISAVAVGHRQAALAVMCRG